MRFLRQHATAALRSFLDLREEEPTDLEPVVQPVFELRALRYWEEFGERIRRWGDHYNQGAVAGQFSFVRLSLPGGTVAAPRDLIWTLDELKITSANGADIFLNSTVAGTVSNPRNLDSRWGPAAALVTEMTADVGTTVARDGTVVHVMAAADRTPLHDFWVGGREFSQGEGSVTVYAPLANQSLTIEVRGRVIYPR